MAEAMEDEKIRKGPCTSEENSLLTSYIVLYDNGRYDFVAKDAGRKVEKIRKGPWTLEEDSLLTSYISMHGKGRWDLLAKAAGLNRSGSSCRLRWVNYLCPHLKHTDFTPEEERLIIELHARWGNRWSRIAHFLPGRTDNAIKNFFRTRIKKKKHLPERSDCNIRRGRHEKVQCLSRSSSSPTSFRTPVFLEDNDEMSSTSLPRQSTEDGQVTYINSMKQENPDTWNVVEGHSTDFPFSFSLHSLNSMNLPELYGEEKQSCSLYNTASSMSFANTEFYSDELWNIDE